MTDSWLLFKLIFYFVIQNFECQELRPAVLVSNNKGVVRTEQVYFGYLGCNENKTEELKENDKLHNQKLDLLQELMIKLYNLTGHQKEIQDQLKLSINTFDNSTESLQNEISQLKVENNNLQRQVSKFQDELNACHIQKKGIF